MAAVLQSAKSPFHKSSNQRMNAIPSDQSTEATSRSFHRFRSSLEQSIRTATRSKKLPPPPDLDDFATLSTSSTGKGKEREKEKLNVLRRVAFGVVGSPTPPKETGRVAGFTSFITPSMRQASMSSPAVHQPSASVSGPSADAPVSPSRQRQRKVSLQPEISSPVQLSPERRGPPASRHRSTKSYPIPPSTPPGQQLARNLSTPQGSSPRATSPIRPSSRARVVTPPAVRGIVSASTSHLPPSPTTPRKSLDQRRPSIDAPRRSQDSASPSPSSPIRPRAISPVQRSYAQNRHFNISSGSLVMSPSSPPPQSMSRELIRTATSMICKEVVKPPPHMGKTEQGLKDWGEVEVRIRSLARLERIWGKSGATASATNVSTSAMSTSGEERERKMFADALRDGYVLCQLMNKLRSSTVVRPDAREDGFSRSSNITKFLAACASYGLAEEDLFQRSDLVEATSESLARVARTIVVLVGFVDTPAPSRLRGKQMSGGKTQEGSASPPPTPIKTTPGSPYASHSRASASTPNLVSAQTPGSPMRERKRWSPAEDMPPLRSSSPDDSPPPPPPPPAASKSRSPMARSPPSSPSPTPGRARSSPTRSAPPQKPKPVPLPKLNTYRHDEITDSMDSAGGDAEFKPIAVPQIKPPPARSPLRKPSLKQLDPGGLFTWAKSAASPTSNSNSTSTSSMVSSASGVSMASIASSATAGTGAGARASMADSTRASFGDASIRDSVGELPFLRRTPQAHHHQGHISSHNHHHHNSSSSQNVGNHSSSSNNSNYPYLNHNHARQSVASSAALSEAETSVSTAVSSILDYGGAGHRSSSGGNHHKFGTIRTMTTDLTSEGVPSVSRTEGSLIAEEMARKRSTDYLVGGNGNASSGGKYARERDAPIPDLSRVAEERETDESVSSHGKERERRKEKEKPQPAVNLRKGVWPDDFMDAFQSKAQPIPGSSRPSTAEYLEDSSRVSTPISISPPRKLAIVGPRRSDGDGLSVLPRRPTHRPRHSIDTPGVGLLPKESLLRRDASPDSGSSPSSSARVMIRRHSTKPSLVGGGRSGSGGYIPRNETPPTPNSESGTGSGSDPHPPLVPFPRTASAEHGTPSPRSSIGGDALLDRPRMVRGRFQSDVEGSSSRGRGRPASYDELGTRPPRSRFESMVNLGVTSGATSASDLMARDSIDGSAVRMRLVVREDGKPPTHFQLGNCIGRGQFGSVYRALNLNTGQMVAVKRIRLEGLKEEEVTTLMREVDLVKSLSHPSIVKYEGMARDDDTLNIVLEYAENGSLGQTLKAFGKLNERLVASYVVKILEGLHYLHTSDVVHCDLKAANILTTKNGNVKLSDFGVSLNLRAMEREKDVAGTPNWMAPEVIELKGASTKSDIWSLGCTVIELLTGRPPYAEIANTMSVMFRIVEDAMPPLPEECSDLLKDFLEQCFDKDPTRRPSAEELCEHPWLKKNWVALKELRPQDSIPFLRRVSTDLQKSTDALRYLSSLDIPETPLSASPKREDAGKMSPMGRRTSNSSVRPEGDFSPREHTFVKTTFSKPMVCRVCLLSVKKTAVLCSQCSLISHSKCAVNSPPTCDLRAQLLLYAQYAEKGNPSSVYSNPSGNDTQQNVAMSDVAFVEHSRTSLDSPRPPVNPAVPEHPPTAFKFMAAFKRSRTNLSPEPSPSSPAPIRELEAIKGVQRRPTAAQNRGERPLSMTSTSTGLSSLRSAATANESFSSRQNTGQRSQMSGASDGRRPVSTGAVLETVRAPKATSSGRPEDHDESNHIPGSMPLDPRRQKKRGSSSGNCIVQ